MNQGAYNSTEVAHTRRSFVAGLGALSVSLGIGACSHNPAVAKRNSVAQDDPSLRIIDAQVHLWHNATPSPMHRQIANYWAEDLLSEMACADVSSVVLSPPSFYLEGNRTYREVVVNYPERFAIFGYLAPDDPASRERVRTWTNVPFMLGSRYYLTGKRAQWWTDGTLDWLWPAAEAAGLRLGCFANGHLDVIAYQAERHPALKIMIDHMAADVADKKDADAFPEMAQLLALARYPNVVVKASGLPTRSSGPYPFFSVHDAIHRVFDAFGPERFMWGSDLTRLPCSYQQCVTMFTEELRWLRGQDLRLVMGDALRAWSGWDPKPPGRIVVPEGQSTAT